MNKNIFFIAFSVVFFSCCNSCNSVKSKHEEPDIDNKTAETQFKYPNFNSDSAYFFVEKQVLFGPRVPNTKPHADCAEWLISLARNNADTYYIQKFDATAFNGKILKSTNIIATFNPQATRRILLVAHWDTRPFADQDNQRKEEPIPGANDGASGVGVLLEVMRNIRQLPLQNIGVDILFVDSEDYGQPANSGLQYVPDSYCLGAQHWSKIPHVPDYKADFGVLLDMVGAEGAVFTREGNSRGYAGWVLDRIWANAARLGYGSFFSNAPTDAIIDDHKYINEIRKIPTIDIIQFDPSTPSGFGKFWHTHNDNMEVIDKATLQAVGHTLLYSIYQYDAEMKPL